MLYVELETKETCLLKLKIRVWCLKAFFRNCLENRKLLFLSFRQMYINQKLTTVFKYQ